MWELKVLCVSVCLIEIKMDCVLIKIALKCKHCQHMTVSSRTTSRADLAYRVIESDELVPSHKVKILQKLQAVLCC